MKILLPHTTGLECASPGIAGFQRVLTDLSASHVIAAGRPSTTPAAPGPRNCGQFCAPAPREVRHKQKKDNTNLFMVNPFESLESRVWSLESKSHCGSL